MQSESQQCPDPHIVTHITSGTRSLTVNWIDLSIVTTSDHLNYATAFRGIGDIVSR